MTIQHGRMWRSVVALTSTAFAMVGSGCGTIFHGTHIDLKNEMNPPGSTIDVYRWKGEHLAGPGASPGPLKVHRPIRHEPYLVRVSNPGHCPQYWLTTSPISGGSWTYLWMMFVPALGPIVVGMSLAAIDGATGGCCGVKPAAFEGTLAEDFACTD